MPSYHCLYIYSLEDYPPSTPCGFLLCTFCATMYQPHDLLWFRWGCGRDLCLLIRKRFCGCSFFDCGGFLCSKEYHFLSEMWKNRLEWKFGRVLKNAVFSAFSGLFLVCAFVQFVQIVYRKDCILYMKIRRRMSFRSVKMTILGCHSFNSVWFFTTFWYKYTQD